MFDEITNLKSVILSGILVLLGIVAGGILEGYMNLKLSEKKLYSELILKALESESADERYESLKFMIDTNLIESSKVKSGLRAYLISKINTKNQIPNISEFRNLVHLHGETKHAHRYNSLRHTHPSKAGDKEKQPLGTATLPDKK